MAISPDFKSRWVSALRSGSYPQAKNFLRTEEGFCCLGVACDLVNQEGWKKVKVPIAVVYGWEDKNGNHINSVGYPPFIPNVASRKLAEMNDAGSSFDEIANWIEESL